MRPTKVEVFDGAGGGTTVAVEIFNPVTESFDSLWSGGDFWQADTAAVRGVGGGGGGAGGGVA